MVRTETASARLLRSTTLTLTLSILGSSVLPVPYAFSRTGVAAGIGLSLLVAYANALTCHLLINAAGRLGHDSYDGLAQSVAGKPGKVVTQLSLVLLLFGSFTGATALLGDVGKLALQGIFPDGAPEALVGHGGRGVMMLLVLCICLPLSLKTHMRALDTAAMFGLIPLAVLVLLMIQSSVSAGFPAIRSGELPLWQIKSLVDLPEAVAILGYAFYCQPMLLPLLHGLPRSCGVTVLSKATSISVMGVASSVYMVVGIFGAARYGMATAGDCLLNHWLGGRLGGLLNLAMAAYLALSAVPVQFALRYTIEVMLAGEEAPESKSRQVACTLIPMMCSVAITCTYPAYAEKIFAVTGALPVALICYIIPTWLHLAVYCNAKSIKTTVVSHPLLADELQHHLLANDEHYTHVYIEHTQSRSLLRDVVLPVLMALLMTIISGFAFFTSIRGFLGSPGNTVSNALLLSMQ